MKIYNTQVVLREFPDEITLALNISNCPNRCKGCHSPYLQEDQGVVVYEDILDSLIESNPGISCVGFMGGDASVEEVVQFAKHVRDKYGLKTGWYSGRDYIPNTDILNYFDYIKYGHYDEQCGPLDSPKTNQVMIRIEHDPLKIEVITHKFNRELSDVK